MSELLVPIVGGLLTAMAAAQGPEVLYNGIELSSAWPPQRDGLTREPLPDPPYLANPPAMIPIDVGRQLFVDDFLIAEATLTRTFHEATYHEGNPVLKPDKPWETDSKFPTAMVFSDGVWYDPIDRLFKMWYMGGYTDCTCYATSTDGLHWEKPELDVVPGTNIVHQARRDSGTVWLDLQEPDPARRYKMLLFLLSEGSGCYTLYFSPDGMHWSDPVARTGPAGDRGTFFYNGLRDRWVYSIREYVPATVGRCRRYTESPDVLAAAKWEAGQPTFWVGADNLDPVREDLKTPCELYNLDCVAYESVLLGLFSLWRGQPQDRAKPNEIVLGFSRDGFNWSRPVRTAFIPVSERFGDWNWGNVQSAGGCCLVVGDELWFYVSGRAGVPGSSGSGVCATGLAKLRRDGFASMDAPSDREGVLTTRPLRFGGKHLFVNADVDEGELRVEVLNESGQVVKGFGVPACRPVRADGTRLPVRWGDRDLGGLAGTPVRFRFHLRGGRLYSFWVSPDKSGASHGYVSAGGPGFTGPTDTVGDRG
ncbi:MAG: glycosyl hydrolase family 32 [Armatimonadetes bacterium]|nr:glycosyl hydrolase family 32 [Armatimonadota bacterium]